VTTDAPVAISTEQPVAGSTAQLQLTFSAECWVTVQDASGARLAYGIKSAGQSLQLTGQLPFSVTLGNATAATVQLNQTVVDLSGYRAGQVARLTLDGQP
jgi:cytoskeleton protein RodZ